MTLTSAVWTIRHTGKQLFPPPRYAIIWPIIQITYQVTEAAIENETLKTAAKVNTLDNFKHVFERMLEGLFIDRMEGNEEIFSKLMADGEFRKLAVEDRARPIEARTPGRSHRWRGRSTSGSAQRGPSRASPALCRRGVPSRLATHRSERSTLETIGRRAISKFENGGEFFVAASVDPFAAREAYPFLAVFLAPQSAADNEAPSRDREIDRRY